MNLAANYPSLIPRALIPRARSNGRSMRSAPWPASTASRWRVARCGASCVAAGGGPLAPYPALSPAARILTSSHKGDDRRALYRSTPRRHGPLSRLAPRTRSRDAPQFPARAGLVTRRAPHQGPAQLRAGTTASRGLCSPLRPRRAGAHPDGALPQDPRLSGGAPDLGSDLPDRGPLPGCRYPPQPEQWPDPGVARSSSPHPARLHSGGSGLAEPDGRVVAPLFRRKAFAGHSLADHHDLAYLTRIATEQLNRHAKPWVWGRPPKPHRVLQHRMVYYL